MVVVVVGGRGGHGRLGRRGRSRLGVRRGLGVVLREYDGGGPAPGDEHEQDRADEGEAPATALPAPLGAIAAASRVARSRPIPRSPTPRGLPPRQEGTVGRGAERVMR